jgi:acyl dehydratase
MSHLRYLEDLHVGERSLSPSVTISEEEVIAFATRYDPQPMHVDPAAAAKGPFGGLIASGWHTAALTMRMMADARPFGDSPVLGLGVDKLEWPQPVRPGDTLTAEVEVESITPSRSHPGHGVVRLRTTVRNQRGEVVYKVGPACWVPRRPNV